MDKCNGTKLEGRAWEWNPLSFHALHECECVCSYVLCVFEGRGGRAVMRGSEAELNESVRVLKDQMMRMEH